MSEKKKFQKAALGLSLDLLVPLDIKANQCSFLQVCKIQMKKTLKMIWTSKLKR